MCPGLLRLVLLYCFERLVTEGRENMDRQRYCVYNQTSECFLSLGVMLGMNTFARLKGIFGKGFRVDEGSWITRPQGLHTLTLLSARDIIYLDENHRVMDVIESFPRFCFAPVRDGAKTILALPPRAVYSSQTQPGNQLLICRAEEMEFRLRSSPQPMVGATIVQPEPSRTTWPKNWLPQPAKGNRRSAMRKRWPRLVAFDAKGSALAVHGIRDISASGIYLMTEERWPLGAQVKMSLQRTDSADDNARNPITVQLRVSRWGEDGVGLEFIQPEVDETALLAMRVQ
jgi:PilZ domain